MPRRPDRNGFFRGSELPRLLLLAGITVAGIVAVVASANRQVDRPEPPSMPRPTVSMPLPPPDPALELEGLLDKTPMTARDNPAYLLLLDRVRLTPPAELDRQARRDVVFSQLIDNPARYRGLPIQLEGTILRVLRQDTSESKLFPNGHFYEAHLITSDSQNFPYILAFEDAPAHLPIGDDVRLHATFSGYFFKLFAYVAGDGRRFAPLLVGRIRWLENPGAGTAPGQRPGGRNAGSIGLWPWLAIGALGLYATIRWTLFFRRRFAPISRLPRRTTIVTDRIDPDALTEWLNAPPEADDELGDRSSPGQSKRDD